ncbi:hypothetical protein EYA84_01740 [Verrucosispora sp. SN26_14.1]|uniref:endonuclease/exonuclease/phosphatase family protein n=1 Tax=Verrucosispora sp. SN26_14.1 TaxID=2527879 RepID=UPI001033186D|nr:endonuclease/exonuclease/phosphatase family protein [Verrucosispora sp. SN26_14.1]TBL44454.1 hypothetical protein EYA84_01740 [Verrucosispora sp. SN26_14.1]
MAVLAPSPSPAQATAPAAAVQTAAVDPTAANLTAANRIEPVAGMPDWSRAGYLGGAPLPSDGDLAGGACTISTARLASEFGVRANDSIDDSSGLQAAIDQIKDSCSPSGNHRRLSLITLPAGRIDITRQIYVDASFLILRGQGAGDGGTRVVFRPGADTRYDTLTADGSRWHQDSMIWGTAPDEGRGGWIWPGRALFKVQTREVAERYLDEWITAPRNRKDLFEGSINQHWASGVKLAAASGDPGFSARTGRSVIHIDAAAKMDRFVVGGYVWVGAANSRNFYEQQGLSPDDPGVRENLHMRQQMFRAVQVDRTRKTVTLDRPLEYDVPVDSTSDGSAPIGSTAYTSKITPLRVVEGVGFENFAFSQELLDMPKHGGGRYTTPPGDAVHNYGNLAPEYAMHGLAFKWAANSWVRGLTGTMTGSHPVVTEVARNLQIEHNTFDGAWNKGKGGNGYLRGSRVWDSLWAYNTSRNLRHFTFQWSASGNVAFRNDLDSDLNLHGGWERYNLFEGNTVRVPYEHRSGNCTANCGGEGGELEDGTWFPIWWAAAAKAIKWSGASGPQNVFHQNTLIKQSTPGGPFLPYAPYSVGSGNSSAIYQFGSDANNPRAFAPLSQGGAPIKDWAGRETATFDGQGVVVRNERWPSLFLRDVGQLDPRDENRQEVITWNMQGAGSAADGSYQNKYQEVRSFLTQSQAFVVALQEAGVPSPGMTRLAQHQQNVYDRGNVPNGPGFPTVDEYRWGSEGRPGSARLYWLHTDTSPAGFGRVNLAVATREPADEVIVVAAGLNGSRPALGVRRGETVFFTVHGWSPGGPDTPALLQNIRTHMQNNPGPNGPYEWIVLGDFNREPNNLRNALPAQQFGVMDPPQHTHPTQNPTHSYDYGVTDFGGGAPTLLNARTLTTTVSSDHFPVRYSLTLRAAAENPPLATPTLPGLALLRNAATTNVADVEPGGGPLVPDTAYDAGRDQRWRLDWDYEFDGHLRLQNVADGRYIGLESSAPNSRAALSSARRLDQLWRPIIADNGAWTLRNHVNGQLLTAITPGDFLLGVRDADGSAEQLWFFASQTEVGERREIRHVATSPQGETEIDVADPDGVENRPVRLLPNDTATEGWEPIFVGQRGADRCFHLLFGDEYLTSSPGGTEPLPGGQVVLEPYAPNSDGQVWCMHQDTDSMSIYNMTGFHGAPVPLYLTDHGVHAQLTVEFAGSDGVENWRWAD